MNTDHLFSDTLFGDTIAIGTLMDQCPVLSRQPTNHPMFSKDDG
jgi:hypothetical protein